MCSLIFIFLKKNQKKYLAQNFFGIWRKNSGKSKILNYTLRPRLNLNITHTRPRCLPSQKKSEEPVKAPFKTFTRAEQGHRENQSVSTHPRSHSSHQDTHFSCESVTVCLAAVLAVVKLWAKRSEGHR